MLQVHTDRFVLRSDVFQDCDEAWELFSGSDPGCSWGDNNRTLVARDVIIQVIIDHDDTDQVKTVIERLDSLDPGIYIDLEN